MDSNDCQFVTLHNIVGLARQPINKLVKRFIRSRLNESHYRFVLKYYHSVKDFFTGRNHQHPTVLQNRIIIVQSEPLKSGDLVRVKSMEEIETTFDNRRSTKGCGFMDCQTKYCGTVQVILNPLERFVDERDMHMKKVKGIVLLEGVICDGTIRMGRCDRHCFTFWREEWLEKITNNQ